MITDKQIQKWIKASKDSEKQYSMHKLDYPNLWLRIRNKNSTAVFIYRVNVNGKNTWYTIGEYPAVTLHQANQKAVSLRSQIQNSINPIEQERQELSSVLTIRQVFDLLVVSLVNKGSAKNSLIALNTFSNNYLPSIEHISIQDLTPKLIRDKLINQLILDGKLTTAHTVLLRCKQLAKFAYEREYTSVNVLERLKNDFFTPRQRDRVLNKVELSKLMKWFYNNHDTLAKFLQLSLYIGNRLKELLTLQWKNVDLQNGTILLTNTKNGNDLLIKLSPQALAIFNDLHKIKVGDYVFSNGTKHFSTTSVSNRINDIIKSNGIKPFSHHDIRRTFSSTLAELGYNLDLIDCATNHVLSGVRKNYVHTVRLLEREKLLCEWSNYLEELVK